jgi:serine/threonine protein kinase
MNPTPDEPAPHDPRLLLAAQEYLAELEAGRRPDRGDLAARFPDLGAALVPYLEALDAVHAASPLLHQTLVTAPGPVESLPPEALGDFRIVREVGRGGMGVVYEAVQRSLGRRVALKVLPFAATLDPRQLQRFQNEAQAAAQLHHPNIVPVFFVGCERGVHFYAMQLIEGLNLAAVIEELCDRQALRRAGGGTPPGPESTGPYVSADQPDAGPGADTRPDVAAQLSTQWSGRPTDTFRVAARLVAQAAAALDYAHGLGIVHRDLKPANLLVDVRGNVWVTDFGLAHFHADAGLTQSGDLMGTLRYMSPEQAGGQRGLIDHRTDIYALGATLYELLTLQPVFDGTDRQTLLRQILHEEPRPPRAVDHSIPVELETIVLKALGKAPAERYATARELADDLQRFLDDVPIRARRPSLLEKATKWARRHRAVVAAAVLALLLCVAGLSVATWLTVGAYGRERQKAAEAEESFRQARKAVDEFARISEEELAGNPFLEGTRRRLLEAVLAYYEDFIDQRRDDPSTQKELEASRDRAEMILGELTTLIGAGQYRLLQEPAVQKELRLSDAQREAVARIDRRWRKALVESGRRGPGEAERRRLALAREQEQDVAQLLQPAQRQRFRQIALQALGPGAFREPDVVAALKLRAEQRDRIRAIEADVFFPRPYHPGRGTPPGEGSRRTREELRSAAMQRVQAVLTPEQVKRWEEMTGPPFKGPVFVPGPARPHGRPGGPR